MRTTEYKETKRALVATHPQDERLYQNVAEMRRIERAYVKLELDASVLRAQPASKTDRCRR